jgi:hypothetical protein
MFGRIPQVALLVGSLVLSGEAAARGHGSDKAILGAVVGAVVGGAIVASQRAPERVYVQAPAPVAYYQAQPAYYPAPVYYQQVPVYYQAYPVVGMPPPPPGHYYGRSRPHW